MTNSQTDLFAPPVKHSKLERLVEKLTKPARWAKKALRKGLTYTALIAILGYPVTVGVGALYYSTTGFTLIPPTTIEMTHEMDSWKIPANQDIMVVFSGDIPAPITNAHSNPFFNVITLTRASNSDFYHELGHIVYQDLSKDSKWGIKDLYEDCTKVARNRDVVYKYLYTEMKRLRGIHSEGREYLKRYNFEELEKYGNSTEGDPFLLVLFSNPEEFFATQFQQRFGYEPDIITPYYPDIIEDNCLERLTKRPTIAYARLSSFPAIYSHMFVQGLKHFSR